MSTSKDRMRRQRSAARQRRLDNTWVFDMETDPFDNVACTYVQPFCVVFFNHRHGAIRLWKEPEQSDDDFKARIMEVFDEIKYPSTFYAHNGGKFDWMLLIKYIRGSIMRKGSSLMSARAGADEQHEIRDSLHIFPSKLATFDKQKIEYSNMSKENREAHKREILDYCESDCVNLLELVKDFIEKNGNCISIGQAANKEIRKTCVYSRLSEHFDGVIRGVDTNYYHKDTYGRPNGKGYVFGGRVECLQGRGVFYGGSLGDYTLFDVNSMYPDVMAHCQHPIGGVDTFHQRKDISDATCFVHLRCRNHGALLQHAVVNGMLATTADIAHGDFRTTIHEYRVAVACDLISDVEIISTIDCDKQTDFSAFVIPAYIRRAELKVLLSAHEKSDPCYSENPEYRRLNLEALMIKLFLNNAYGKFVQNPRNFHREWWLDENDPAPEEDCTYTRYPMIGMKHWRKKKDLWDDERTDPDTGRKIPGSYRLRGPRDQLRFHNSATGASITGAARAKLLYALYHAVDPLYCDTDSIICRSLGNSREVPAGLEPYAVRIHGSELGCWKPEKVFPKVEIAGKKLYCYTDKDLKATIRSKGAAGLLPGDFPRLLRDEKVRTIAKGVTIMLDGSQIYQERWITATANDGPSLLRRRIDECHNLHHGRPLAISA